MLILEEVFDYLLILIGKLSAEIRLDLVNLELDIEKIF
jgi:hypothetical protein